MLTPELIARVRQLELRSKRAVNEVFAGEYVSAFKGRGMEFSEVRSYQPGDDVRLIDWNVTARAGEPFVKRFIEERELTVLLVMDVSASASFGSIEREKRETAAELGALLAMVALRSNDKVGVLSFDDEVRAFVPPRKGKNHGLRVMRELLAPGGDDGERDERLRRLFGRQRTTAGSDPVGALEHLGRFLKKRAIIVFVSDFLYDGLLPGLPTRATREMRMNSDALATDTGGASPRRDGPTRTSTQAGSGVAGGLVSALKLLRRRHDMILACVSDPREEDLPSVGLVELVDLETGERRLVDTSSRRVRRRVKAAALAHADRVRLLAERAGADLLKVRTGEGYVDALLELFHRRERRQSR
jgi:uncharacterized protein (DUF58 family)